METVKVQQPALGRLALISFSPPSSDAVGCRDPVDTHPIFCPKNETIHCNAVLLTNVPAVQNLHAFVSDVTALTEVNISS